MNSSFYTAGVGAMAQQAKLDVVSNNITNANTFGYKTKNSSFSDLLYKNVREPEDSVNKLRQGSGARVEKTDNIFTIGAPYETTRMLDFAINGDGFFAVENPLTGNVTYTRDGSFYMSEGMDRGFYLVTGTNEFVLDKDGNRIVVGNESDFLEIGVFDFPVRDGMLCVGDNRFQPMPKNGAPYLNENAKIERGRLESSNVNLGSEMVKMIHAQRAYQLALRMVQTSDEVEGTINNLR